eukprot:Gb_15936 [translate_table: standard]
MRPYDTLDIWPKDAIHKGYGGVDCVEEVTPLIRVRLKIYDSFHEYFIILFHVLGDVIGVDYCIIVIDNGFDVVFIVNHYFASISEKKRTHPL